VLRRIEVDRPEVLAFRYEWQGRHLTAIHNLSDKQLTVRLELPPNERRSMTPVFGNDGAELRWKGQALELEGYGYRWISSAP
jgi:hypothetical protein